MEEVRKLMELDERVRELIGLYAEEHARAERYRQALMRIRDSAVGVAETVKEVMS